MTKEELQNWEKEIRTEFAKQMYKNTAELIYDAEIQIAWMNTEAGKEQVGEDKRKETIEAAEKKIAYAKQQLEFLATLV